MKIENERLESRLACHTAVKAGKRISDEWLPRIFLSSPGANARGLAKAFHEVAGMDGNTVSRSSMGKVRGAWVEMFKPMVLKLGVERVLGAL